ncbi:hypothetical protein [Candidatus Nitrospira bockiana]
MWTQSLARRSRLIVTALALVLAGSGAGFAADGHTTTKFEGVKANAGTAMHARQGDKDTLSWSDDFKIPDTPAPHWQVVDSKGHVYLLNRLRIKGGLLSGEKDNRTIVLPPYVHDVAKVQIWCAWAEALLGEASFAKPIMTASGEAAMKHAGSLAHADGMAMGR